MAKGSLIAQNTFQGGMNQDSLESLTDSKTYRMARNAIHSTRKEKNFGITNEGSNELVASVPHVVGSLYCEERNWTVLFSKGDQISIFDHATKEVTPVMNADEFGCSFGFDDCEWIGNGRVEFKSMEPCSELMVYFSAGCEYFKVNIDLMLDPERKQGLITELNCDTKCGLTENCEYFKVFKQGCAPKITPKVFQNGGAGGELKAGAYTFVARFVHTDGGETNWFHFSDPAFVGSPNNIAGEKTSSYIDIGLSCLDCKFASIELAVIENIGGIITAKTLNTFNYGNNSFSYRYNGTDGIPIDIKELLVKEHTYLRGKYLQQKDGHMLYYGIQSRKNPNMQPPVNGIETEYVIYEMPYEHVKKHNVRSLMRGETYAFSIIYNYIDGSHSKAFHIPAIRTGAGVPGDQKSSRSVNISEQENDNASLLSPKSPQNSLSNTSALCEYRNIHNSLDATCSITKSPGEKDKLKIFLTGNTLKTDLLKCSSKAVQQGKATSLILRDSGGKVFSFNPSSVAGQTGTTLTLLGEGSESTNGTISLEQATLNNTTNLTLTGLSIPPSGGSTGGSTSGQQQGSVTVETTHPQEVIHKRMPKTDIPRDPQFDHYDDVLDQMLNDLSTTGAAQCEELRLWEDHLKAHCCWCYGSKTVCAGSEFSPIYGEDSEGSCENPEVCCGTGDKCDDGAAYEQCIEDLPDFESAVGQYGDLLDYFTQDQLEVMYSSNNLLEGARNVQDSIKRRERIERKRREYSISKSVTYSGADETNDQGPILTLAGSLQGLGGTTESVMSGQFFDCNGNPETEIDIKEVSSGRTRPDREESIRYSCQTDCNGDFIYGGLAGENVAHHKFPDASEEPHFVSKSVGVPYGTYWTDAGETSDLYIRIMGVRFNNIPIPDEKDLPLPLCPNNPYTIGMVKRTDSNKKVIVKGLATGTFTIDNNGKQYDHPRHGLNSLEEVSYYHDDGDGGRLSNAGSGTSHTLYSLDGVTFKPSLAVDSVFEELRMAGVGERYGLYAKGKDPDNALHGRRLDALGARQSVNIAEWSAGVGQSNLDFAQYATGNDAISPGAGGTRPLMNRSGQPCIWFGSGLPQITDQSFTGDVLEHNVPIPQALGQYVSLRRDLQNQYGNLENLNYIPLLHGGKNGSTSIEGPVGDVYIGPYSFVKTGFVSDKIGSCETGNADMYDIPSLVPSKNEMRCICDGPEDIVHQANGAWVWTTLPEDGDASDPKNWAGTQTEGGGGVWTKTRTNSEATGQAPVSDFYFPGTVTTHITYIGEFETNPWLREKSDLLSKQWYSEGLDRSQFRFDSGVDIEGNSSGWEDSYLNQFHRELEQASVWQRVTKTLIKTTLNILFPMFGVASTLDVDGGAIDFAGNLVELPIIAVLWYLMVKVLFTNERLDKILGIPQCKSDEVGGFKEGHNKGLFFNPTGYNVDYSTMSDIYTYEGLPDTYHVCDCSDCPQGANVNQSGTLTPEIYISDRQIQGSIFDAYTHVRPRNKIHIPASYGNLTNLFVVGGNLFAHTTDAIIPIRRSRAMVSSDIGEILLGNGGFLLEPEGVITEGITEGYAGLKRHNEHIDTQYGYFFIDGEADVIYRFRGQGTNNSFPTRGNLEAISVQGMSNFFKEKLNFCEITDCLDERVTGTSYYSLGVDPRFNRLLVTKSDGANSFTISYDFEKNVWVSFHDYIPRDYIWDRRDMYTLNDEGIWLHNKDCNYQTFYGEFFPYEVQFTAIPQDVDTFIWDSIIVNTESERCVGCTEVKDLDKTFNKMAIWNSTQGTGTLEVEFVSDDSGKYESARKLITETGMVRANKKRRMWRINEFKDFRKADCREEPMLLCNACDPIASVNEGIFDCSVTNKQNFKNKVIADKYLVYRFIYDLDSETNLKTIYVNTFGKPSEI